MSYMLPCAMTKFEIPSVHQKCGGGKASVTSGSCEHVMLNEAFHAAVAGPWIDSLDGGPVKFYI